MYYEYWQLQKPPFDNVPDPSMYAECHTSMENAIAETLFAIEEGNECLSVIIGDVGLGKTLSLRIIIDSLPPEKYQMALITNPSISFIQLLNEIIGQLTEVPCNEKKKVALLELFNKLLFQASDAGKKIVVFIDEANAILPANLESLRLLTNMQDDRRNLFTLVLAGQIELARRLEDPKRANLFQRIGTYSRIEKIDSPEQIKAYVETRLRLAGATRPIFTEDTYPFFWRYSEQGVPRLINKIAKLSLKAGETYGLEKIDARIVYQVGRQFEKITVSSSRGRSKKKREETVVGNINMPLTDSRLSRPSGLGIEEIQGPEPIFLESELSRTVAEHPVVSLLIPSESSSDQGQDIVIPGGGLIDSLSPLVTAFPMEGEANRFSLHLGMEKEEGFFKAELEQETNKELDINRSRSMSEELKSAETTPADSFPTEALQEAATSTTGPEEILEDIQLGKFKVRLHLPSIFIEQALASNREDRFRMAGQAAVNAIKQFSQMTTSPPTDPVSTWNELRSIIFNRLNTNESEMNE
jgi:type II secretory pathway predicted ATPase ExeA